jgi:hypothetical protein
VYDGESNFLETHFSEIKQGILVAEDSYCKRLEQYVRAATTSLSVILEGFVAGVLYDVVAYVCSENIDF